MRKYFGSNQVAYITRKVFADGSDEIRIKHNPEITITTIVNAIKSKAINKIKREAHRENLKRKLVKIGNAVRRICGIRGLPHNTFAEIFSANSLEIA